MGTSGGMGTSFRTNSLHNDASYGKGKMIVALKEAEHRQLLAVCFRRGQSELNTGTLTTWIVQIPSHLGEPSSGVGGQVGRVLTRE
jgi:hypothetical protein